MRRTLRVKDMDTGEKWPSISEAAAAIGATQGTLTTAIQQHRACKGRWIVLDESEVLCACCRATIEERKTLRPNYAAMTAAREEAARAIG